MTDKALSRTSACYRRRAKKRINSLPHDKILDSSELKEFADDNFKFDENGRKLSKRGENTVGKGEIARYEWDKIYRNNIHRKTVADIIAKVLTDINHFIFKFA